MEQKIVPKIKYLERMLPVQELNFPVCLAPMVGLSHVGLRLLVREYLPFGARTIWPTEMLNSRRLPNEIFAKTPELFRSPDETQMVPQILGNEEVPIAKSMERLSEWGISGVDINMGCPVKKALMHNYGVALMGDRDYAARVVDMTVKYSEFPVSVKLRAGNTHDTSNLNLFVKALESAGASWITLHPRLAHEKRRGTADWSKISEVRDALRIPVIGNGDVQVVGDVFDMLAQSQCDMVMVGRALTARPWLLWQVGEMLGFPPPLGRENERAPRTSLEEGAEYGRALARFIEHMEEYFEESLGIRKIKFFLRTSTPWLEFGHDLHAQASSSQTYSDLKVTIDKFFSVPQKMMARTSLRI